MPDNPPPLYRWAVSLYDGQGFTVEAAYPVLEDGDMLLKDQAHKIVFAAERGTGCTFRRGALVTDPAVGTAPGAGNCPRGFPATVRCHECSPVTAQAEADAAYIRRGTVPASEIRGMRDGRGDDGDTAGAKF